MDGYHHSSLYSTPTFISQQSVLQIGASTRQRDSEIGTGLSRHNGPFCELSSTISMLDQESRHMDLVSLNMGNDERPQPMETTKF
jgi:hypothetical protein